MEIQFPIFKEMIVERTIQGKIKELADILV